VSVGGVQRFHAMFEPLLFKVLRAPAPDMYRLPPGVAQADALAYYLDRLQKVLDAHHAEIAAVVMEPLVQAAAGMLMHPRGYLAGVRELTRRYDVLLIADEVAVGFGRAGTLFACEQEHVTPDLLAVAKGLSGGYLPLAATLATREIWQAFLGTFAESKTFFHGHTYGGNPLGAAAALASLDVFDEEQTLARLPAKAARLDEHLARIAEREHVGDTRRRGLIAAVELVRDRGSREPYAWTEQRGMQACRAAREHGVLLRPLGNVIVIMPPLSVTLEELDRICLAAEAGIQAATE
jgi:adenosylmethionine---8-amino-7-oxononanoate aminotransferase